MAQLFSNNAYGVLNGAITDAATSITLVTGQGIRFPVPTGGDYFKATLVGIDGNGSESSWEIVKVTSNTADTLTVVRGQEGTTASAWASGSRIEMRATKGAFDGFLQLVGGVITGPVSFVNGAYTSLKVGLTGLVSIGGEAGSSEAKLTITDGGNAGLEFSPTAIPGANRILSYNRASMAYASVTYMASEHVLNVGGVDKLRLAAGGSVNVLAGLFETKAALAANNIDLATGNFFTKTASGATTLTVSNVPASGLTASFILDLTNGGSATVTWWSGVKWAGGTAPTLTAAGRDVLGFFTHDGGTTWSGLVMGKDVK